MRSARLSQCLVVCRTRRPAAGSTARRSLGVAWLGVVCAMLVSCGGEPRLVPPVSPSPRAMPQSRAAAAATPVSTAVSTQLGPIVWASAVDPATSAPVEPVSSYRPDAPRIIAAMQNLGLSSGSSIEATWEYNDTSLDAFSTRLAPAGSGAESWISFYIERAPDVLWPVGTYEVTVSLNGSMVQQATIEVTEQT